MEIASNLLDESGMEKGQKEMIKGKTDLEQ